MPRRSPVLAAVIVATASVGPATTLAAAAERPVVVELFTSEGCSSCPPADTYLTELSRSRPDLLPLAFHVTYWNSLGWKDPFSLEAATRRQARYAERFGDGSYTPEMVVDGIKGVVGSDRSEAAAAIERAGRTRVPAAPIHAARSGDQVTIELGAGQGPARVVLIGFDPEHRTAVGRGENSGRTLLESNIVRSVRTLGTWTGSAQRWTAGWPAGQQAAVLLEAEDDRIVGAVRLDGGTP